MHLKRRFFPLGVSAMWNHSEHREQTPGGQLISAMYIKLRKNIMKYLYMSTSKNYR